MLILHSCYLDLDESTSSSGTNTNVENTKIVFCLFCFLFDLFLFRLDRTGEI